MFKSDLSFHSQQPSKVKQKEKTNKNTEFTY